jgi:hypothetical protein
MKNGDLAVLAELVHGAVGGFFLTEQLGIMK